METLICRNCGSSELVCRDGIWICPYCGSKFIPERSDFNKYTEQKKTSPNSSDIDLSEDVKRLLLKCRREPRNARKYANLILDIDPDNREALKYL